MAVAACGDSPFGPDRGDPAQYVFSVQTAPWRLRAFATSSGE